MLEEDGQQAAFIRREMIKDSLSPVAPTVDVLAHLQKRIGMCTERSHYGHRRETGHLQRPVDQIAGSHI